MRLEELMVARIYITLLMCYVIYHNTVGLPYIILQRRDRPAADKIFCGNKASYSICAKLISDSDI